MGRDRGAQLAAGGARLGVLAVVIAKLAVDGGHHRGGHLRNARVSSRDTTLPTTPQQWSKESYDRIDGLAGSEGRLELLRLHHLSRQREAAEESARLVDGSDVFQEVAVAHAVEAVHTEAEVGEELVLHVLEAIDGRNR